MIDRTLGGYIRTSPAPDDMDGGVAATLIEKEVGDREDDVTLLRHDLALMERRAEKAEQERDEALAGVRVLARENIECHERVAEGCGHPNHGSQDHDCAPFLPAAEPRPLTPDDITDEMIDRAHRSLIADLGIGATYRSQVEDALTAALTEPPARPEWEQEGAKALTLAVWGMEIPNEAGEAGDKLAASLARHGYQVVRVEGSGR